MDHSTETTTKSLCIYRQNPQPNPILALKSQPAVLASAYPEAAVRDASLHMQTMHILI